MDFGGSYINFTDDDGKGDETDQWPAYRRSRYLDEERQRGKRGQQWQVERAYQPEQQVEQPAQDDVHGAGSPASTASPSAGWAPGNGGRATSSNPSGILPSSQASNTARAIGAAALPP